MPIWKCFGCERGFRPPARKTVITSLEVQERFQAAFPQKLVSLGDSFCEGCRRRTYPRVERESDLATAAAPERASTSSDISDSMDMDVDFEASLSLPETATSIEIGLQRVVATERRCFVCGSTATRPKVPPRARQQAFLNRRVYIPKNNRCCPEHLTRGKFYADVLSQLSVASNSSMLETEEVKEYMELISQDSGATLKQQVGERFS